MGTRNPSSPTDRVRARLRRSLFPLIVAIAAMIGLGFPVAYLLMEIGSHGEVAEAVARDLARKVADRVDQKSDWKATLQADVAALGRFRADLGVAEIRIVDADGTSLAVFASGQRLASWAPTVRASEPIAAAGEALTARVTVSLGRELASALPIFAVPLLLGVVLAVVAYRYPIQVARDADAELSARTARLRRVEELSRLASSSLDRQRVLEIVTEATAELLDVPLARLWVLDEDAGVIRLVAQRAHGAVQTEGMRVELPLGQGIAGQVVLHRERRYCPDVVEDPSFLEKDAARAGGWVAMLVVPLMVGERVIGALGVTAREPRAFSPDEEELLETFAAHAATALENARLFDAARGQQRRLATLVDVGRRLTRGLDPGVVLASIGEAAAEVFGGDAGFRVVEGDSLVRVGATAGALAIMQRERLGLGESISGHVAATGEPVVLDDLTADPRLITEHRARHAAGRALMCVPVRSGRRVLGTLNVYGRPGVRFDRSALSLALSLADQSAVALENARLYDEARARSEEREALLRASRSLMAGLDLQPTLEAIIEEASAIAGTPHASVMLVDRAAHVLRVGATRGATLPADFEVPLGASFSGRVVSTGEPVFVADTQNDTDSLLAERDRRVGIRTYLGLPIKAAGEVLGVLILLTEEPHVWSAADLAYLGSFADQAALAIRNARLYEDLATRMARLRALTRLNQLLSLSLDQVELLREICATAAQLMGARVGAFWAVDESRRVIEAVTFSDPALGRDFPLRRLSFDEGIIGWVARARQTASVDDVFADARFVALDWWRRAGLRSFFGVPVLHEGDLLGVLALHGTEPFHVGADDQDLLDSFVAQAAVAIRNARLYGDLATRMARLRALTRLNRLVSSSLDQVEVLREINETAAELMGARVASFWMADEASRTLDLLAFSDPDIGVDWPVRRCTFDQGLVGVVAQSREPVSVDDAIADPRNTSPAWWERHGIRSFFGVPIVYEGELLGVLALNASEPFRFGADDQDLLYSFVAQAAVAIRNARLYGASESRRRLAEAVAEVGRVLAETLDPDVVAARTVERVSRLLDVDLVTLYRRDPASGDLVRLAQASNSGRPIQPGVVYPRGTTPVGEAVEQRRAVVSVDVLADPAIILTGDQRERLAAAGARAVLGLPMMVRDEVIGALGIAAGRVRSFSDEEIRIAQTFADQAALAFHGAHLYKAAERALAELGAKNAELDAFVYSVSHDLKAPLVAIQGMAGALVEDQAERLDDQGRHYLRRLQANVAQMERLIQDLLALSRVGREARRAEVVSLAEVVDEVLQEWSGPLRARGIKVTVGDLGTVRAIRSQVEQVLGNLIGNAVKYMGDGAAPAIEVGSAERENALEVWVRDNGIGIDPAYHEKVFEVFQRLREIEAEGTGVGLAIVRKIVEAAGGRIWVESAKGQGATFRFTWPREAATSS